MFIIMASNLKRKLLVLFILGTTSVLPTLWGEFVFDDGEAVVKNADVIAPGWENVVKIFKHDFWGVDITHRLSHKSYRPLTTLTYRLDYFLWGRNPFPFHLVDLLLHGINCALVFIFLKKCIQHKISSKSELKYNSSCKNCETIAFWGALLFSVHPIHVEPLGAIVGRADLLASFVFLGAFCLVSEQNEIISYTGAALFALSSVFGALFKETAIALSVLSILLDVQAKRANNAALLDQLKMQLPKYILILGIAASFVLWRLWLQAGPPVFQPYDNPPAFADTLLARAVNIVYIWTLNVFLLLCPIWLCYDWSMGCVQLIESWWDVRFLFVTLFICVCLRVAFLTLQKRLIMISALIFSATFLPSSNLLFTVGFVLAERNLYLPSIGYCLFIAYVFLRMKQKKLLMIVVVTFYSRSVHRSFAWVNQGNLFESALNVCPNNAKVHYNLGTMYGDLSNYTLAENSYRTAISLRPDYYQAMNNLGNLLRVNNRLDEAEQFLSTAVRIKPDFAAAWMNLGIVLSSKNQTAALACYHNALRFRKAYPDCEYNLGNLYLDMGHKEEALQAWKRATTLKPIHSQAWINSVILLEQEAQMELAKVTAQKALEFLKKEDTLHFILGNILGKLSEFESAKISFETAIKLRLERKMSVPPKYFSNLGVLYHRWGKKEEAIKAYQQALKIDPRSESTRNNLNMLMKSSSNKLLD